MTAILNHPSLQVRRLIKTNRARVFDAWTKPELMKQWLGGQPSQITSCKMDVRVGGAYVFNVQKTPGGPVTQLGGVYREVTPPARLVFTWDGGCGGESKIDSLVTVDLAEKDGGTEVCIKHERFPDADICAKHNQGWIASLDVLEKLLS